MPPLNPVNLSAPFSGSPGKIDEAATTLLNQPLPVVSSTTVIEKTLSSPSSSKMPALDTAPTLPGNKKQTPIGDAFERDNNNTPSSGKTTTTPTHDTEQLKEQIESLKQQLAQKEGVIGCLTKENESFKTTIKQKDSEIVFLKHRVTEKEGETKALTEEIVSIKDVKQEDRPRNCYPQTTPHREGSRECLLEERE